MRLGKLAKAKVKPFLVFGVINLALLGFILMAWRAIGNFRPAVPATGPKTATQSGFSTAIEEAEKKAEESRRLAEEEQRKVAETRQFIAQYGPCKNIPILMYHHVGDNRPSGAWLYVRPAIFAQQMDFLIGKGYTAITLPEVMAGLAGGALPAKPVVITFDDGYADIFTQAYPILHQKNLKATVFIITQLLEGSDYMTWEQLREMNSSGIMTIGNHTLSHRALPKLTEEQVRDEIVSAREILNSHLGINVNTFAYPFGNASPTATKILGEIGTAAAVTASRGLACAKLPYALPRIRIGNGSLSSYGL